MQPPDCQGSSGPCGIPFHSMHSCPRIGFHVAVKGHFPSLGRLLTAVRTRISPQHLHHPVFHIALFGGLRSLTRLLRSTPVLHPRTDIQLADHPILPLRLGAGRKKGCLGAGRLWPTPRIEKPHPLTSGTLDGWLPSHTAEARGDCQSVPGQQIQRIHSSTASRLVCSIWQRAPFSARCRQCWVKTEHPRYTDCGPRRNWYRHIVSNILPVLHSAA